ncbi:hypothetical protein HY374_00325 [Candidatus Berkelbacteria bacterium]|nr:hypothetical protein [Candidatus Berkelbacteria bacterium]
MTGLILGADRKAIRIVIDRDGQVVDETVAITALDRHELARIEPILAEHGVSWAAIDELGVLILPHSHTSVRITTTLATVAGWVYDRPIVRIEVPQLGSESAGRLLRRLRARLASTSERESRRADD